MPAGSVAGSGPFRGLFPFDEASAALFFGRTTELGELLRQVTREGTRATALTGESGVGKTSLLRAGLIPRLGHEGVLGLYLGRYAALEPELWQAAARVRAEPPGASEAAAEYLVRLARGSRAGAVLVLDHLEELLVDGTALAALAALLGAAAAAAGPRLRVLFSVESSRFHELDRLHAACGLSPAPGAWLAVPRLAEAQATEILEQTALQTGTFFEAGLSALIASDLCRQGPCLPADLQIVARTVVDLRLTSVRRYERSGGADLLVPAFFDRIVTEAGGRAARRLLVSAARHGSITVEGAQDRFRLPRERVDRALSTFAARGLLASRGEAGDAYALVHPCLAARIEEHAASDGLKAREARRALRRRVLADDRLSVPEMIAVRRHLMGTLSADEQTAFRRSLRRTAFQAGVAALIAVAILLAIFFDLRTSYALAFEPGHGSPDRRVVVRLGRPSLSFLYFLPSRPSFGEIIADTGFSAAGMSPDLTARVATGHATGTLERDRKVIVPGWLRAVLDGRRPVPRGVALVLLGDPNGVVSLKQAFADPLTRREALDALAVIGSGRAGEEDILAGALADASPEIRRRGVEVAAAIGRRLGRGAHATALRSALADRSPEVRGAVLRECATLDTATAADVLALALADRDAAFRQLAEKAVTDLAARAPAAATDAVRLALRSPDGLARRSGMDLLDQIAARAPDEAAAALTQIVAEDQAPEEARVAALQALRRAGVPAAKLQTVLEQAVAPSASPRLRAAALPLYVRLLDPERAQELARAESKGSPAARATAAAVWGALAARQPEAAHKALKALMVDPAPEVRIEAARSYGHLRRDGIGLIQRALLDPHPDVQRAALESAVVLGASAPGAVAEGLGKSFALVRPAARRFVVDALGRIARDKPAAVVPTLARLLRESDGNTRAVVAGVFCQLAKVNATLASPYLRAASRDSDRDVRAAAAGCLGGLVDGDPQGAARIAIELASAEEAAVRTAAAASLGILAPKVPELTGPALVRLLGDPERAVRVTTALGVAASDAAAAALHTRRDDADRALAGMLARGDLEERRTALRAAGKAGLAAAIRQGVGSTDEAVRLEAVAAAATLGPDGVELLRAAVADRSPSVSAEAIRRLATVSPEAGRQVLTVFEGMLRSGDPEIRRAGARALGELTGAPEGSLRLLQATLRQRGEAVRAAAAAALGRIAQTAPDAAAPALEAALADPAHDVRLAAIHGLGALWAARRAPRELGTLLETTETDSARRLVALEGLVLQARGTDPKADQARQELARVGENGPPLARLAAQVGRAFLQAPPGEMHVFLETLLGT